MFGGKIYKKALGDWQISWESLGPYRLWCYQEHPDNHEMVVVVMLNPGSLSHEGERLSQDTTLRILREVFTETNCNPFIINLFNIATPSPAELFENWANRDCPEFDYAKLPLGRFKYIVYAYGDYENGGQRTDEIKARIDSIRSIFSGLTEIQVPTNKTGTPKHPVSIQRLGLKDMFRVAIQKQVAVG